MSGAITTKTCRQGRIKRRTLGQLFHCKKDEKTSKHANQFSVLLWWQIKNKRTLNEMLVDFPIKAYVDCTLDDEQ